MPSDRDLEQQFRAFGTTLADHTGEPITPSGARPTSIGHAHSRRRWALLGAAACVVALIVGLLLIDRRDPIEEGAAAPTTAAAPSVPSSDSSVDSATSPTAPAPGTVDPASHLSDDPLGLVADGWVRDSREVEAFEAGDDPGGCEGARILAGMAGEPTVHEIYTSPVLPGLDVDVTYLPSAVGPVLRRGFEALADCPGIASAGPVTAFASSDGASGFQIGEEFALIAVGPDAPMVPLAIALELESEGVTDELIGDLQTRALRFLAGEPVTPTVTTPIETAGEVPVREATAAERAELDGDDRGLVCDSNGIGGAEWDYGEIGEGDPRGRRPVDAFRDALAELAQDALSDGGRTLPTDGWTELVVSDSQSSFALEVDGVRQGVILVSGDPALGVWRHTSADLCQSLFLPEGYVLPSTVPASTTPPPARPPITTGHPGTTVAPGPGTVLVDTVEAGQPVPEIGDDEEVYVLVVSNQSFADDRVQLTIAIDGWPVAADVHDVGSQHTTTSYVITGMSPGPHELTVESDTGVSHTATVTVNDGAPRWAFVTYWYYPDDGNGRFVDVLESDEPIAIA